MHHFLQIHPEVRQALQDGKPVVALESTIISHGMPWPENAETARRVEEVIRENGAVPATIAVIDGQIKVGLSASELETLGRAGPEAVKCSRRDLPYVMTKGCHGATTVAATMLIAAKAGISVFATGGLGGVHRKAQETFDVSADLQELAQTNVAVVCAGPKAILDLSLTREYLETHGVPVLGFRTDDLPAFYTRISGYQVDYRLDTALEMARFLDNKWRFGLDGGVVITNPIPEEFSMDRDEINNAIGQALSEADQQAISGKESTPFLLKRVAEITGGDSLKSNIQLVLNNAALAAQIAGQLAAINSYGNG